jgi:hypothetical protein
MKQPARHFVRLFTILVQRGRRAPGLFPLRLQVSASLPQLFQFAASTQHAPVNIADRSASFRQLLFQPS